MTLRRSDELHDLALQILDGERARLRDLGVPGELVLVGSCSVRGLLTRGDVDLHLRVPLRDFAAAVTGMRRAGRVVRPEIWAPTLATFEVDAPLPTGVAVTPVGSEHDVRFARSWQRMSAEPGLVAAYNAVKLAAERDANGYEVAKSAFFDALVADVRPADPAAGPRPARGTGTATARPGGRQGPG